MKNLYKALAEFQQEVPIIHKKTEGYGYTYADLPAIFTIINPILKKNGLGFTQLVLDDVIKTIVFHHESGEQIESSIKLVNGVTLVKMNPFQVLGSQITYLRRYAISSMLGLVTDEDNDGNPPKGDDKKPQKTKKEDKVWLSKDQYDKAMLSDIKGIEATLKEYSKMGYGIKTEYRLNLTTQLGKLK